MRRSLCLTGLGAALLLFGACDGGNTLTSSTTFMEGMIVGSGVVATEPRGVSEFGALTVNGPLRVVLEQGGGLSLEITADDNVLPYVRSEVRGGRLFLGFAPNPGLARIHPVVCRLTARELRDVEASGAAQLEMSGIAGERLGVELSGAAIASASGAVGELRLDVSGASRWSAGELVSQAASADVSGASYALVRASDSLVATVSGASVLEYLGDPLVQPAVSGVSVLRRVGP
jgi:hypothetical protein